MGLLRLWALPLQWELCLGAANASQEAGKKGGRHGLPGVGKMSKQKLQSTAGVTLLGFKNIGNLACPCEFCFSWKSIMVMGRVNQVFGTCSSSSAFQPSLSTPLAWGEWGFWCIIPISFVIVCA